MEPGTMKYFETAHSEDPSLDFCLWDYPSPAAQASKLRSVNLLYNSFKVSGSSQNIYKLCDSLREGIGDWRTVWGVKNIDGRLGWEFYFYDYKRLKREVSIKRTLEIFRTFTNCELEFNEDCLYFMFSIDIDDNLVNGRRALENINVYLGDISEHVSAGICYYLDKDGLRMDNIYHFFDVKKAFNQIMDKIVASLHLNLSGFNIDSVLIPALVDCQTIVIANKKFNDGIYFCRINIDQLIYFLEFMDYPLEIQEYVGSHRDKYDHLLYDVGIDYRMEAGKIRYLKSSYYGVF